MTTKTTVYIYTLTDPISEQVRYVGKTNNPKRRYRQHLYCAKQLISHSQRWIQGLLDQGLKPEMQIIETTTRSLWREREQYWIQHYQEIGSPLTNLTEGGGGWGSMHHTPEACERISQARQGMKFSKEHKAALSASKDSFYTTERGKQVIESLARRYAALTDEQVVEVYLLAHQNVSQVQIAKMYHIPSSSVSEIKTNKRYKYVKRPPLPLFDPG